MGRWTQRDPSGMDANPYAYVGGDPVNHTDPSGLFSPDVTFSACYGICGNFGVSWDDDDDEPHFHFGGGGGFAIGADLSVTGAPGNAQEGASAYAQCAGGMGRGGITGSDEGGVKGYGGLTTATRVGCDVGGQYTF